MDRLEMIISLDESDMMTRANEFFESNPDIAIQHVETQTIPQSEFESGGFVLWIFYQPIELGTATDGEDTNAETQASDSSQ